MNGHNMHTFTASNKRKLHVDARGCIWLDRESVRIAEPDVVALREFFRAEENNKPWHNAKEGEVWALTVDGLELVFKVGIVSFIQLYLTKDENPIEQAHFTSPRITAGHRIWPTEES